MGFKIYIFDFVIYYFYVLLLHIWKTAHLASRGSVFEEGASLDIGSNLILWENMVIYNI